MGVVIDCNPNETPKPIFPHQYPIEGTGDGNNRIDISKPLLGHDLLTYQNEDSNQNDLLRQTTLILGNQPISVQNNPDSGQPIFGLQNLTNDPNQPVIQVPNSDFSQPAFGDTAEYLAAADAAAVAGLAAYGGAALSAAFAAELGPAIALSSTGIGAIIAVAVLAITALTFGIMDAFAGRPKMEATSDIAKFANSPSRVLSLLGQGAIKLLNLKIPVSSPAASKIFATYFKQAVEEYVKERQALGDTKITIKSATAFMSLVMHELGNYNKGHHGTIIAMLRLHNLYEQYLKTGELPHHAPKPKPKPKPKHQPNTVRKRHANRKHTT